MEGRPPAVGFRGDGDAVFLFEIEHCGVKADAVFKIPLVRTGHGGDEARLARQAAMQSIDE
jgi:hypothetical protein